jgi:hypothetical protein
MYDLPLQIIEAYGVVVDDADGADTRGCEIKKNGRAEPPCADDKNAGRLKLLLALATNFLQHQMAFVSLDFLGRE